MTHKRQISHNVRIYFKYLAKCSICKTQSNTSSQKRFDQGLYGDSCSDYFIDISPSSQIIFFNFRINS